MKTNKRPTLFIFGGLPGTGKSTLSAMLARKLNATYLRIDTIEQAIRDGRKNPKSEIGPEGYLVGFEIARENLKNNMSVIADSVNPIAVSRKGWLEVARDSDATSVQVEIHCSNKKEHRHRIESRTVSIKNLKLPTWKAVCEREYEPWHDATIRIDTANRPIEECLEEILNISNLA